METLYVVDFRNLSLTIVGILIFQEVFLALSFFLSVKFNFIIIFTLQYGYQRLILGIEVSGLPFSYCLPVFTLLGMSLFSVFFADIFLNCSFISLKF